MTTKSYGLDQPCLPRHNLHFPVLDSELLTILSFYLKVMPCLEAAWSNSPGVSHYLVVGVGSMLVLGLCLLSREALYLSALLRLCGWQPRGAVGWLSPCSPPDQLGGRLGWLVPWEQGGQLDVDGLVVRVVPWWPEQSALEQGCFFVFHSTASWPGTKIL